MQDVGDKKETFMKKSALTKLVLLLLAFLVLADTGCSFIRKKKKPAASKKRESSEEKKKTIPAWLQGPLGALEKEKKQ